VDDVSGSFSEIEQELPKAGKVKLRFAISDGKASLRQPGITLRVDGKSVGKPSFFGLDKRDDFPARLLRKLYGEVNADGLRDHITAGWDAPVENSELLKEVEAYVQPFLKRAFEQQYQREMQLAQARLKKVIQTRLAELPEHKDNLPTTRSKRCLTNITESQIARLSLSSLYCWKPWSVPTIAYCWSTLLVRGDVISQRSRKD